MANRLILASASKSRGDLLRGAGLNIVTHISDVDENIIKAKGLSVQDTALELAKAKALTVSQHFPGALVIGADQMMECEGQRFDKPVDLKQAREQLCFLRAKTHRLLSAVSVVCDGICQWSHLESATLEMRDFSDDFLDSYLKEVGNDVLTTVGGYRLESLGVQLFKRIEGDYFTILGLPLLALLEYLRTKDVLAK